MRLIDADALLTDRRMRMYYHLPNGDTAIPIIDIEHAPTIEERKWIPCSERLPEVSYDYLGNWHSPTVILLMNDEEYYDVCCGHFNPIGIFEGCNKDGVYAIGSPVESVMAWMPFPEPHTEDNT